MIALDAAWKQTATRLAATGERARIRVVAGTDGRARLHDEHFDAVAEPDSLASLRGPPPRRCCPGSTCRHHRQRLLQRRPAAIWATENLLCPCSSTRSYIWRASSAGRGRSLGLGPADAAAPPGRGEAVAGALGHQGVLDYVDRSVSARVVSGAAAAGQPGGFAER